jgi:threonyl-tRNA synthetase
MTPQENKPEALEEVLAHNDHRRLGKELDLFTFSDLVGSGLPLWTPRGTLIRNLLDEYVWQLRKNHGFERVEIPHITKKDLYEKSGHWDKFKDELFKITTREGYEFAMKPMNCPHHTQIYARRPFSYRELPQRYANTTMCYRDEQSGELNGLARVRSLTQDDAHVFCRKSQIEEEMLKVWDIIRTFYTTFGFETLKVRFSRHDPVHFEKYLGTKEIWKDAEDQIKAILENEKVDYLDGLGEAALYGPKIDFMATDSLGREWQVATIQLDLNLPDRFDLTCINEKGEKERIAMIHCAIMGSIERFMSVLIEHYAGAFPTWIAPVQVKVLPIGEHHHAYAETIAKELRIHDIRVELDATNESLGERIRTAKMEKVPYLMVVGDREIEANTISLESRTGGALGSQSLPDALTLITQEVAEKR